MVNEFRAGQLIIAQREISTYGIHEEDRFQRVAKIPSGTIVMCLGWKRDMLAGHEIPIRDSINDGDPQVLKILHNEKILLVNAKFFEIIEKSPIG